MLSNYVSAKTFEFSTEDLSFQPNWRSLFLQMNRCSVLSKDNSFQPVPSASSKYRQSTVVRHVTGTSSKQGTRSDAALSLALLEWFLRWIIEHFCDYLRIFNHYFSNLSIFKILYYYQVDKDSCYASTAYVIYKCRHCLILLSDWRRTRRVLPAQRTTLLVA